jgi:hypothetical protein
MRLLDEAATRRKEPDFMALPSSLIASSKNSWLFFQTRFILDRWHYDPILRTLDNLCKSLIYFIFSLILLRINCASLQFISSFSDYTGKRYLLIAKPMPKFGLVQPQDRSWIASLSRSILIRWAPILQSWALACLGR